MEGCFFFLLLLCATRWLWITFRTEVDHSFTWLVRFILLRFFFFVFGKIGYHYFMMSLSRPSLLCWLALYRALPSFAFENVPTNKRQKVRPFLFMKEIDVAVAQVFGLLFLCFLFIVMGLGFYYFYTMRLVKRARRKVE
ncbi:hypothetical protein TcCL_ESM10625 [Trypanosoma cruzi]|nr:hypothetical protein TcCL_ESM10625 [Trypanosoma cruzi]